MYLVVDISYVIISSTKLIVIINFCMPPEKVIVYYMRVFLLLKKNFFPNFEIAETTSFECHLQQNFYIITITIPKATFLNSTAFFNSK